MDIAPREKFHRSRKGNRVITVGLFVVAILIFGGLAGDAFAFAPAGARNANIFDSFLNLFRASTSSKTAPAAPVALYKPVIDYEQAVVAAVKKASPAVVSITISKNVPIIENCPVDPFSNLPPEFQHGIFAKPQTFKAWVRFCGPGPYVTPDIDIS